MEILALLIAGVIVLAMVAGVIGLTLMALAAALKLIPLVLAGYVVVRLVQRWENRHELRGRSTEAWLDAPGH